MLKQQYIYELTMGWDGATGKEFQNFMTMISELTGRRLSEISNAFVGSGEMRLFSYCPQSFSEAVSIKRRLKSSFRKAVVCFSVTCLSEKCHDELMNALWKNRLDGVDVVDTQLLGSLTS